MLHPDVPGHRTVADPLRPTIVKLQLALLCAGLLLVAVGPARGSQESERLVADGHVAYQAGRYEEARDLFEQAVHVDESDVAARYALGLALSELHRWDAAAAAFEQVRRLRPEFDEAQRALDFVRARQQEEAAGAAGAGAKPWEVHATTGAQYDSNVRLDPGGRFQAPGGAQGDAAAILSGGGAYDVLRRADRLVRLEYDLYQTLHGEITDFDFRSHRVRGTASYAFKPALWAGVQGAYEHYTLGPHSYLSAPSVMPFVSLLEGSQGLFQVTYRHGWATYLSSPFHEVRDGPTETVAASQTFYRGARFLVLGYLYGEEHPTRSNSDALPGTYPDDYRLVSYQGWVSVGFPAWFGTTVDLMYLFRYDDYTEPNSRAGFRKTRLDVANEVAAGVRYPIAPHLSAAIVYYGTFNGSNIGVFEYHRHVGSGLLEVTF